jgi:hypothetical protein
MGRPSQVAIDILSFLNSGKPTADLYAAHQSGAGYGIVTEPGKAILESRP